MACLVTTIELQNNFFDVWSCTLAYVHRYEFPQQSAGLHLVSYDTSTMASLSTNVGRFRFQKFRKLVLGESKAHVRHPFLCH
jgi:hypothetical protein